MAEMPGGLRQADLDGHPGLIFIRMETVDFKGGLQTYVSPFEAFIEAAVERGLPYFFILPTTERDVSFANGVVEAATTKVGSARGVLRGVLRLPEILAAARALRSRHGPCTLVVRVPEHTNMLLLPLLSLLGFKIAIWLVHDRRRVSAADRKQRATLRSWLASAISKATGGVEKHFLRRVPVIANGKRLADEYCGTNGKVRVVYSTLLTQSEIRAVAKFREDYKYDGSVLRLVFAGRVSVEKGIDRLLDFYEILTRQAALSGIECRLTIVGKIDQTVQASFNDRLTRLNTVGKIDVPGFVKRGDRLWEIFSQSDFFCLLSAAEGTPRVLPEAFASGLPVIVSSEANADQVAPHSELVLENEDLEALAQSVLTFFRDRERYLHAREQVSSAAGSFTIDTLFQQFRDCAR